ncbi:hypothetical protein HDU87_001123 [Geranomyces variabilis]|uniref:Uncharacterized protein n=1 Tax=Geranomyces variabilis TaxID=109894 RepID=A0AAD5TQ94_9FUNG|nr:hypothetical protein HDU87_001123 [Geranomyces variabilis]
MFHRTRPRSPPRPRPLAPDEGGASPSFVRNFVRAPVPKLLSARFLRTAHLFADVVPLPAAPGSLDSTNTTAGGGAPAAAGASDHHNNSDDEEDDEQDSLVSKGRGKRRASMLPPVHRHGQDNLLTTSSASNDALPNPTTTSHRQQRHIASPLPAPRPYVPFPLQAHSSFSPSSPTTRRRNLPLLIRAKYSAYAPPPNAEIAQMIERSDQRARGGQRRQRKHYMREVEAARARWGDWEAREMEGARMAEMARKRMKEKMARALELRENEVQILVEGQPNSIDAIVLKEHLALRPRRRVDMHRIYTESDRERVDRLIAG